MKYIEFKEDTFEKELKLKEKRQKEAAEKIYAIMMLIDMYIPKEVKDKIENLMTEMES